MTSSLSRGAFAALVAVRLLGCGYASGPPRIEGPGPSDDVATRVAYSGEVSTPSRFDCAGPTDEIAALGAICGTAPRPVLAVADTVGDLSFVVGDTGGGPKILVMGYFDPGVTSSDHRADIRYSAYFLADSHPIGHEDMEWYVAATLAEWTRAIPLVGEIATEVAEYQCGSELLALATFTIGNVVVTAHVQKVVGC